MGIKKGIVIIFCPLVCASFIFSQSLVETAKKEKERRAKLKEKSTKVVTNVDLAMRKREPALTIIRAYIPTSESTKPLAAQVRPKSVKTSEIDRESQVSPQELEAKSEKADEYVELLTLKINGLWQKFYSFRDWTLRDDIQREMAETYEKLQKAKQDAEKAKRDLKSQRSKKKR